MPPADEREELEAYLGAAFDERALHGHEHGVAAELARLGDEQLLYRRSEAYLYDLTAFSLSGTKAPYLDLLRAAVAPGARVLDYGCGIGSDGLALLEAGYDVEFADFDNPSTRYLRWRLERRGRAAAVHDVDAGPVPGGFDLVFALDVIEHVEDPFAFLARLEGLGSLVLVNFLGPRAGDPAPHRRLPIAALVRHAAARGLRRYAVFHGRSHLVLYAPGERTPLRSAAALARGLARR
ncbi:MAG TPA: methyltransferase domain-containing protein [Solirubrobacteraceae bacterium]|jgi:SAM-dependent methyltransferase